MPLCKNPQCDKENASLQCVACKSAFYCSKQCQTQNWKSHKVDCQSIAPTPPIAPTALFDTAIPIDDFLKNMQFTRLLTLCKTNDLSIIHENSFIDPSLINYSLGDVTLLLTAVCNKNLPWITYLLQQQADPNQVNRKGETPLWYAARHGYLPAVPLLLGKLNIEQKNNDKISPLLIASIYEHLPVVQYLIEQNADMNTAHRYGVTPLCSAATTNNFALVEMLIRNKADPNQADHKGQTPLWMAVKKDSLNIVKILIENKADLQLMAVDKDCKRLTPLDLAKKYGFRRIERFLAQTAKLQEEEKKRAKEIQQKQAMQEKLAQDRQQSKAEEEAAQERRDKADNFFQRHGLKKGLSAWTQDHRKAQAKKWMADAFFEAKSFQRGLNALRKHHQLKKLSDTNQSLGQLCLVQKFFYIDHQNHCLLQTSLPIDMQKYLSLLHLLTRYRTLPIQVSGSNAVKYFWQTLYPLPYNVAQVDKIKPKDLDLIIDCSQDPSLEQHLVKTIQRWTIDHGLHFVPKPRCSPLYSGFVLCEAPNGEIDKTGLYKGKELMDITIILSSRYCSNDPIHITRLRLNLSLVSNLLKVQCVLPPSRAYRTLSLVELILESYHLQCLEIEPPSLQYPPRNLSMRLEKYIGIFKTAFIKPQLGDNLEYHITERLAAERVASMGLQRYSRSD